MDGHEARGSLTTESDSRWRGPPPACLLFPCAPRNSRALPSTNFGARSSSARAGTVSQPPGSDFGAFRPRILPRGKASRVANSSKLQRRTSNDRPRARNLRRSANVWSLRETGSRRVACNPRCPEEYLRRIRDVLRHPGVGGRCPFRSGLQIARWLQRPADWLQLTQKGRDAPRGGPGSPLEGLEG